MAKFFWEGQEREGVDISFKTRKEEWNEYELMDGTIIRMKVIVSEVIRLDNLYDNEGNPRYIAKSANMLVVKAPENLKRKA